MVWPKGRMLKINQNEQVSIPRTRHYRHSLPTTASSESRSFANTFFEDILTRPQSEHYDLTDARKIAPNSRKSILTDRNLYKKLDEEEVNKLSKKGTNNIFGQIRCNIAVKNCESALKTVTFGNQTYPNKGRSIHKASQSPNVYFSSDQVNSCRATSESEREFGKRPNLSQNRNFENIPPYSNRVNKEYLEKPSPAKVCRLAGYDENTNPDDYEYDNVICSGRNSSTSVKSHRSRYGQYYLKTDNEIITNNSRPVSSNNVSCDRLVGGKNGSTEYNYKEDEPNTSQSLPATSSHSLLRTTQADTNDYSYSSGRLDLLRHLSEHTSSNSFDDEEINEYELPPSSCRATINNYENYYEEDYQTIPDVFSYDSTNASIRSQDIPSTSCISKPSNTVYLINPLKINPLRQRKKIEYKPKELIFKKDSVCNKRKSLGSCSYQANNMSSDNNEEEECSVRVAIRIRPQNSREIIDMCRICTSITPSEPQINLGVDKAFTFDYVFGTDAAQPEIYQHCVEQLVEGALRGYNATVLAYGQTGSGKTYTMGTGFDYHLTEEEQGIIPRALFHIFSRIEEIQLQAIDDVADNETVQFNIAVQFIELYNENIIDLLEPYTKGRIHKIQENELGLITVSGATIKPIQNPQEALRYLQQGALARTTASTQMNVQSSRSHAVFTLLIRRLSQNEYDVDDYLTLTSKFHFVDLAGSERLKRTGATGDRAREGISINSGLLALGNCISALGDKSRRATHVPYRDSKLTRLLQDSLGGNSQTLMIACISPSDRDFMETLNTLKYANRAKNIKNKVQLNQDQSSRTIAQLRKEIARLQLELMELKQGKREINTEGKTFMTDTFHENEMLLLDNKRLQQRLKSMNQAINILTERNTQLRLEKEMNNWPSLVETDQSVKTLIQGYISEIEKLQAKLIESEEMYQQLRKNDKGLEAMRNAKFHSIHQDPEDLIKEAKRELEKEKNVEMTRSSNKESNDSDESEQESQQKSNDVQEDLEDVNNDIEIKTKLIQQLELSQQRMQLMRQQYEDKLMLLSSQVINTQKERDEVLTFIGSNGDNQNSDKMKKVKAEYEQKINNMQREIKKLHQAQKEHNRQRQEIISQETKLKNLRTQLQELKFNKARLIRKLGEQASKFRIEETQKIREIAQLRKEQRKQENAVRSLQAKVQAKEQVLKRKTEEVTSLRRSQRSIRRNVRPRIEGSHNFDARAARKQWYNMSHVLDRHARNKQMMMQFENELERLMNERDRLTSDLIDVQKRTSTSSNDLDNEEDLIKSNLTYVQESINNTQQALLQFDESKDFNVGGSLTVQNFINEIDNIDEAKYLLERLSTNSVDMLCKVVNLENHLQERIALLKEAQQECLVQQQLLQHFIAQNNLEKITDLFESLSLSVSKSNCIKSSGSQKSLKSNETYDIATDDAYTLSEQNRSSSPELVQDMINKKIRSRTAQPYSMLFGEKDEGPV